MSKLTRRGFMGAVAAAMVAPEIGGTSQILGASIAFFAGDRLLLTWSGEFGPSRGVAVVTHVDRGRGVITLA